MRQGGDDHKLLASLLSEHQSASLSPAPAVYLVDGRVMDPGGNCERGMVLLSVLCQPARVPESLVLTVICCRLAAY